MLLVLLTAGLLLAGSAQAKGPHAILTPGGDPPEAGVPWEATLEVAELGRLRPVGLLARRGAREVSADVRRVWSDGGHGSARYDVRLTLPSEGRWSLLALSGKRRFGFDAVEVGSGKVPPPYVAFATGSRAEREGAGGVYHSSGDSALADGTPSLPPEEFSVAADADPDGSGVPLWILPLAGMALAGAGVLRLRSR